MADLATRYLEEHAPKKRSGDADGRLFQLHILPRLATMKVAEVSFGDLDRLHQKITRAGKAHQANRVIALLSKAFNLAVRWHWRDPTILAGASRRTPSRSERAI